MPLEASAFPDEVQVAFFVYDQVSEKWEGMSGSYMGKNWAEAFLLFKHHKIEDPKQVLFFMQLYDSLIIKTRAEESDRKQKAKERRSAGGGKQYTHNVQG